MQPIPPSTLVWLVVVPLLLWRMVARVRRMVGRQRFSRVRSWVTLAVFPLLVLALGLDASTHVERLAWLAAGLACGAALGRFGLRHTRFEPTPQGLFYTPQAHLGIALSLLLIGRIAFRLFEVYTQGAGIGSSTHAGTSVMGPDFARSPLTLAVFGLLSGYYIAYAIGLVRWSHRAMAEKRMREQATTLVAVDATVDVQTTLRSPGAQP